MPYAIVTGATHGMGKAIAEKLLHEGFSVAICARGKAKLDEVKNEWYQKYPAASIFTYSADLSVKEEAEGFADAVLSSFPSIDLLVNNAGMFVPGLLTESPVADLEKLMRLNFYGAYYLTMKIAPAMKKARHGHIFNTCSVAAIEPHPDCGAYSISKYALFGMTENLRMELKPHNVKVTAICPGSTNTSSWDGEAVDTSRLMLPSDIANMLWSAYSLSPQACVDKIIIRPVKD